MPRRGRSLVLGGAVAGLLLVLYLVRQALPPFLGALALVYLLNPAVIWWQKRGLPRGVAIAVVYAGIGAGATCFFLLLIPRLLGELGLAVAQVPVYVDYLSRWASGWQTRFHAAWVPVTVRTALNEMLLAAQETVVSDARQAVRGAVEITPVLASLLLSPFLAYFLLRDLESIKAWLFCLVPWHLSDRAWRVIAEVDRAVGGFFRGQVAVAGLVGALVTGAMFVLGMPFPFLLGLAAGLADLIPYFGPLLGGVPAVLLALTKGGGMVVKVVLALAAVQQVEAGLLAPRIVGQRTGLHPVLVAGAVLAGGNLGGLPGAILAVPLMGALRPLLALVYERWIDNART